MPVLIRTNRTKCIANEYSNLIGVFIRQYSIICRDIFVDYSQQKKCRGAIPRPLHGFTWNSSFLSFGEASFPCPRGDQ